MSGCFLGLLLGLHRPLNCFDTAMYSVYTSVALSDMPLFWTGTFSLSTPSLSPASNTQYEERFGVRSLYLYLRRTQAAV